MSIPPLSTTQQAAEHLGVSIAWVRRLAKRNDIGWRAGRDWVFTSGDIEQLRGIVGAKPGRKRVDATR